MQLTLLIFSGRPDPSIRVPTSEQARLRTALDALPREAIAPRTANLGYRGVRVDGYPTASEHVVLFRGELSGDVEARDPGRVVEQTAHRMLQRALDPGLWMAIEPQLT